MKKINELDFGNNDALSYKNKSQKEKFKKWFVKDDKLDRLCSSDISFLIGEKGMGKTAYAVFMSIEEYRGISSDIRFVRDTDYKDFLFLKKENHLLFSDYTTIWEMIILLLMSKKIVESERNFFDKATLGKVGKLRKLNEAIDSYFLNSFTPEVATAIQMVRESNKAAEIFAGYEEVASIKASIHSSLEEKGTRTSFQRSMYYIIKKFKDAISDLKLDKDHYIFIDGIDIRPSDVEYDEYIECIRGLSHAVLKLNGDFFQDIKDTKGYCRAVLLIRPDIFESLALHNMNSRIKDNSIVLNWTSNYDGHRRSSLFHAVNKMISSQVLNDDSELHGDGTCWDYYFPWDAKRLEFELPEGQYTSFISFLRLSYHRPRDIFSMLDFLKVNSQHDPDKERFSIDDFNSHSFQRDYSNYLLGEIKDQLSFYYKPEDYEVFIKFFTYLNGNYRFSYEEFCDAFGSMKKDISTSSVSPPKFMSSTNDFLQFLFELNVVCSIEDAEKSDKSVVRWCFRERTQSNLFPKIRIGARSYEIFYGLRKALQVDIAIKQRD
jgi:hypothetical protein